MDSSEWYGSSNDLPLLSNTTDILVRHFILDLECSMTKKTMSGTVTLFLDPSQNGTTMQVFSIQKYHNTVLERLKRQQESLDNARMSLGPINKTNESSNISTNMDSDCRTTMGSNISQSQHDYGVLDSSPPDHMKMDDSPRSTEKPFEFILDCCDIEVSRVESLQCTKSYSEWLELFSLDLRDSAEEFLSLSNQHFSNDLLHKSDKWSLRIWDSRVYEVKDFPRCVKVHYKTKEVGASLRWAVDQDGNDCVYTAGMWINNRSLLPCQEYGSMSTWQSVIRVPMETITVLMSGDEDACVTHDNGKVAYYYKSRMPLPSFSLAVAIGSWQCAVVTGINGADHDGPSHVTQVQSDSAPESDRTHCASIGSINDKAMSTYPESKSPAVCLKAAQSSCKLNNSISSDDQHSCSGNESTANYPYMTKTCHHSPECHISYCNTPSLPSRIFAPKSLLSRAVAEFKSEIPRYSIAVQKLLGPCPFPRVDIVIYPPCSQDMAMSNPNLLFISQSVIAGDGSMCVRLGHELSHYWFGLLIGARDWTEEWLSEGFATYVEDIIEASVHGKSKTEQEQQAEMAAYLRYKSLIAEVAHTSKELQTLRPNKGEGLEKSQQDAESTMFIKNGMNPDKLFTQVHYLKGYFLLRWIAQEVGLDGMQMLLCVYVVQHHGQMVNSRDFINLAFHHFAHLRQVYSVDEVCSDWLDGSGIPTKLKNFAPSDSNILYVTVLDQFNMWVKLDRCLKRMKSTTKRRKLQSEFCNLNTQQLLFLVDKLLEKSSLCKESLTRLNQQYNFNRTNAEIQHRWLELVVKHKYVPAYSDLGRYLVVHQAMGVYLYGEMVIARCRNLRLIAKTSFNEVKSVMEPTTRNIVQKMLYGS